MRLTEDIYLVGSAEFGLSNAYDCHVYLLDGGEEATLIDCGVGYDTGQIMVCKELSDNEKMRVIFQKPYLTDPSYGTKLEEDKKQIVKEVLKKHGLHEQIIGLPYGCDASKLAKWGIPVFVFGPGSIEQAHTKEEYIEINQIGKASEVLKDLVLKFTEKE